MASTGDRSVLRSLSSSPSIASSSSSSETAIVNKLHGAFATLRRERDELHRCRQVAVERLRLAREEREELERKVASMEAKLEELTKEQKKQEHANDHGSGEECEEDPLQQTVANLRNEAQFQHAQLVEKKERLVAFKNRVQQDTKDRAKTTRLAREALRRRRQKLSATTTSAENATFENGTLELTRMKRYLSVTVVEGGGAVGWGGEDPAGINWAKWARLIEQKATQITAEACDIHRECEVLQRRIDGYKTFLSTIRADGGSNE